MRSGRPFIGKDKRVRISLTVSPKLFNAIKNESQVTGISRSILVEQILAENLDSSMALPFIIPQEGLKKICREFNVHSLSLFGSTLKGTHTSSSDLDLLVRFHQKPTGFGLERMREKLEGLFGNKRVDLRTAEELSPLFRKQVLKEMKTIYES